MFMRDFFKKVKILSYAAYVGLAFIAFTPQAHASPFGQGKFGADVPFGAATSLSMALSGNVSLNLTSDGSKYSANGSHDIIVTSTDVVGYSLYAYALNNSNMTNGSNTIPASANSTLQPLAINSWGYNLDGSNNYLGFTTTPTPIKTALGPFKNGDTTTVTYGVTTDLVKAAGAYTVSVVYTAACLSQ